MVAGTTTTHLYRNTKPDGDISNATAKVDQHYCRNSQQQLVAVIFMAIPNHMGIFPMQLQK